MTHDDGIKLSLSLSLSHDLLISIPSLFPFAPCYFVVRADLPISPGSLTDCNLFDASQLAGCWIFATRNDYGRADAVFRILIGPEFREIGGTWRARHEVGWNPFSRNNRRESVRERQFNHFAPFVPFFSRTNSSLPLPDVIQRPDRGTSDTLANC